jgi:hypothetical protein
MLNRIASLFLAVFSLLYVPASLAGSCTGCTITNIGVGPYYDSLCSSTRCAFVRVQAVASKPACATNSSWDFVLDISTDSGRSTYALLLTAYAAGKSVNMAGRNQCAMSPTGFAEDFYWMSFAE